MAEPCPGSGSYVPDSDITIKYTAAFAVCKECHRELKVKNDNTLYKHPEMKTRWGKLRQLKHKR